MKTILITGANSYIGEAVKDYLCENPNDYSVSVKDTIGWNPEPADFKGIDVVFNVAGIVHIKEDKNNRHLYYDINRDLAIRIAKTAKESGVRQFVSLSSMAVYGLLEGYITKDTPVNPKTAYAKSKAEADEEIEKLADNSFKVACLRPPMVYGKNCKGNYQSLRRFALKTFCFPNVQNERSMVYIGNLCDFIKNIIDQEKNGLFFPQNADYVNTSEMVKLIAQNNNKTILLTRIFNLGLKLIPIKTVKKVFGSLKYEKVDQINKFDFTSSIRITETSKKPSIVVLSSYTPSLFWYRIDMMKCFLDKGYDVYAVADQETENWDERFSELGIKYRRIFVQRNGVNPFKDLRTLRDIVNLYREVKPEKVFSYQAKSTIYGGMASRIVGGIEVYPMIGGIGSVFLSNTFKSRIIKMIVTMEYRVALRKAKAVFFQNSDDEETFRKNKIINRQTTCRLAGSGVNTECFTPMQMPEKTAFLLTARLIKDKGVMEYLQACEKLKSEYGEIRCLLVGPIDTNPSAVTEEELRPYIKKEIIEYYGNQDDVRPFLEQSSIFVLPSYREGTPKAVLEAMACARAIITTDTPGCKETVEDGVNGFLIPIKDSDSLYKKMRFLAENPDVVESMAKESRRIATEKFDVRIVNEKICRTMKI